MSYRAWRLRVRTGGKHYFCSPAFAPTPSLHLCEQPSLCSAALPELCANIYWSSWSHALTGTLALSILA
eukprot:scaffold191322_cov39-Tisochrysis_lutea.AAC.3